MLWPCELPCRRFLRVRKIVFLCIRTVDVSMEQFSPHPFGQSPFAMRIALYQPDIAQNTGAILRLAACLNVAVDIIGPAGFDISSRALRRAALDYFDKVDLKRHG